MIRRVGGIDFVLRPEEEWRLRLRMSDQMNGLLGLTDLSLAGTVRTEGRDVMLEATLAATVIQPCVVTLEPVTTRIEAEVRRHYTEDMPEPDGEETEMPEDDTLEPLSGQVDLGAVMAEALVLNLPLYPRAEGVEFEGGEDPDDTEDTPPEKPFAGLAGLRDKLSGEGSD
ncbi:DUF177 domain-containing protein [Rhodobacterales bacterium HKCCE2091]|nr:DUF177 domain-containing protein [Rhodobacterales bacterium HKCCE2091]